MDGLVTQLLDRPVVVVEGPVTDEQDGLWPEELAYLGRAAPKRRREFATGRRFAHRALEMLGTASRALPIGPDRSPRWPDGITGSITHGAGYCAVAVARTADAAAIGIDIEDTARFRPALLPRVLSPQEIAAGPFGTDGEQRQRSAAAMFSAKESLYKSLRTLSGTRLHFHECAVTLDPASRVFAAGLLVPAAPFAAGHRFTGRFAFGGGLVATAILLPPARADRRPS
ncbi:MAG TPA: 4'-phosphopantetheinyl transferase superfamily protein [bacterium]|nr:4'-phosphopantetheinyl transferase superfamily protein [bacterium]